MITKIETAATETLRSSSKKAFRKRYDAGDMTGAIYAAAAYAKESGASMFVYTGNSYMHLVRRVTFKRSDAENRINNCGGSYLEVSPDLTVTRYSFS